MLPVGEDIEVSLEGVFFFSGKVGQVRHGCDFSVVFGKRRCGRELVFMALGTVLPIDLVALLQFHVRLATDFSHFG